MAISSSAEFDAQQQEAQWSRRFAALASTLPGTSLILSSLAETSTVLEGQESVPGLVDLRKHFDGSHASRDANNSGVEHTKRQHEAFRSAMDGVPSLAGAASFLPSIFFSFTNSAIRFIIFALFT